MKHIKSKSELNSKVRLLLGSGGFFGKPETVEFMAEQTDAFLGLAVSQVLVVPYAQEDYSSANRLIERAGLFKNRSFFRIDEAADPVRAIEEAQAIVVFGGNTFRLLNLMYQKKILGPIQERVLGGTPYLGVSAGTNVACPTLMTTNDMPIVQPPSFNALNLVPFQINPHYFSGPIYSKVAGEYEKYAGETRDDRISEFLSHNEQDVLGLPEGTFLRVEAGKVVYLNPVEKTGNQRPVRVFRKGRTPEDFGHQVDLVEALGLKPF